MLNICWWTAELKYDNVPLFSPWDFNTLKIKAQASQVSFIGLVFGSSSPQRFGGQYSLLVQESHQKSLHMGP